MLVFTPAVVMTACFGDRFEGAWVRNDGPEPLKMTVSIPGGQEYPVGSPLPPGRVDDVGFVSGGPGAPEDVIVKAYDPRGVLVYCRRFTPAEYEPTSERHPVTVTPGDGQCR